MLVDANIVVLDLETLRSADDCRYCGKPFEHHYDRGACAPWQGDTPSKAGPQFRALGWDNKPALGLSIGCYFAYRDGLLHWFDHYTLFDTMRLFVETQPLLVSWGGIAFDFPLMRGLLRQRAETMNVTGYGTSVWQGLVVSTCDTFKELCARSYDMLAELWKADPGRKFERGLNSLGAVSAANGYGAKELDGAQAPRLWAQGQYAAVLNYCAGDVWKTKALFEQVFTTGCLVRGDGTPISLPVPGLGLAGGS